METLKPSHLLIILSLGFSTFTFSQTKVDFVYNIITDMEVTNTYDLSYTVGYAGTVSQQYLRLKQLLFLATEQQLLDLASNHKSAVVRLYTFKALLIKKIKIPEVLLLQFVNDNAKITTLQGCIGGVRSVSSLAKEILRTYEDSIASKKITTN
jgi:hypothetical protein